MSLQHPTKNDLPETTRQTVVDLLNASLANGIDLALQARQAHWNVKGPGFYSLHELFEKAYDEANDWVDTIAERAVQLGGVARGTLQATSSATQLAEYGLDLAAGRDHVDALSAAVAAFGKTVRASAGQASEAGDEDTADLFTEVSRGADKLLWFLEAHLQSDR